MAKTINESCPALLVELVVETCLEREGIEVTDKLVSELTARANYHFAHNAKFKKEIKGKGNEGRDNLYKYITHWIKSKYWEKYSYLKEKVVHPDELL